MSAVSGTHVAPTTPATIGRVRDAWFGAPALVRRATVLAAATSLLIGGSAAEPLAFRAALALTGGLLVTAALVDVRERRLPNRLLLAALATAVAPSLGALDTTLLWSQATGGLLAGGAVLAVHLVRGVGLGDVKAAAVVGASAATIAVVAAPVAVAVTAVVAATWGAVMRRQSLPLGPSLWVGWAVALVAAGKGWA